MKNKLSLVLVLVVAVLMVVFPLQPVAHSSLVQGLVGLPAEGLQLILFLVTAVVAWLLLQLGTALGLDLAGYIQPIVAIVAPIIVAFIEKYLGMIAPIYDNVVLTIIHLIVLLVGGALGTFMLFKRVRRLPTILEN